MKVERFVPTVVYLRSCCGSMDKNLSCEVPGSNLLETAVLSLGIGVHGTISVWGGGGGAQHFLPESLIFALKDIVKYVWTMHFFVHGGGGGGGGGG